MKKKADVITQINAQEIWKNENTSRIEEQCMSPFIDNVSNDIAEITGYTELEFIDKEYNIGDFRADLLYRDNITEPTLKSKACLKFLYFTIIIFDLCRYLEYFSYLCTINQTE